MKRTQQILAIACLLSMGACASHKPSSTIKIDPSICKHFIIEGAKIKCTEFLKDDE